MHDEILSGRESRSTVVAGDTRPESRDSRAQIAGTGALSAPPNLIRPGCETITPQMLTLCELDERQIDVVVRSVPGGAANIEDIYPLSPLQAGMLFHHLLNHDRDTYVLSTLFEIESASHLEPLVWALQRIIDRYDVLRSAVLWEGLPQPLQVVYRRAELIVEYLTLEPGRDAVAQLKERMRPGRRSMNLQRAPLVELQVASQPANDRLYALLRVHHVICDHQSLRTVVAETLAALAGRERREAPPPYRSYVASALAKRATQDAEQFFRRKLSEVDQPTAPFDLLNVHGDGSEIEEARSTMPHALAGHIRVQARESGISPARLFHAAWALVVSHTSGRDDVVYGTVVLASQQRTEQARGMLGMSVNTLPLRLRLSGLSARELVQTTHHELTELVHHEHVPLTVAQGCSGVIGTTPLFTTLLNYRRSLPHGDLDQSTAAGVRVLARGEAWSNYPISVTIDDLGDGFELTVQAPWHIGPQRVIDYLCQAMRSLLGALATDPHMPALEVSILPEHERHRILDLFNATEGTFPADATIAEVYAQQLARTPTALAVVCGDESLTYAQLDARANQLARYLRARGVGPDQLVGLCVERSIELFVGLLGVLKAGGGYVPLDANHPVERLAYMLQDAGPSVVLTQARVQGKLPRGPWSAIALDQHWHTIAAHDSTPLDAGELDLRGHHLAYVIYTSGSTGRPKGVMIEHRHVLNLWQGLEHLYAAARPCSRVALNASLTFDASVQQWVQLLSGRTVYLLPDAVRPDADQLLRFLERWHIDAVDCTPSQLRMWVDAGLFTRTAGSLRLILVGGEAIDPELWQILARNSDVTVFNVYGPTECTVDSTAALLNGDATAPHIGRPMLNRRVYILDRFRQPVPIGVAGEIYIGGGGIGRSYVHRPDLTEQRFLVDPFDTGGQGRVYRSGDLGRWRPNGVIEYLGRNDDQVKIRGYRIELGEIEAQLLRHEQISAAAVLAREDETGEKRLVAYVVAAPDWPVSVEVLRAHLLAKLPEYMVPSAFVMLERLPVSSSGKVDRRALPAPDRAAYSGRQFEPPVGEVEELVAGIWQALLRIERVGRHDNFFELGGHSLLIVQLMDRLRRVGLRVELRRIYESPTLADLASALTSEVADSSKVPPNLIPMNCPAITPQMLPLVRLAPEHIQRIVEAVPHGASNVQDIYPLTPLQQGILFHHLRNAHGRDTYARSVVLEVASRERLQQLIEALQVVIDRHDVLRTAILWEQLPQPVQVVCRKATLPVSAVLLDESRTAATVIEEWLNGRAQRIELTQAPVLRLEVASEARGRPCFVLLRSHHIVGDYSSQEIITAEISSQLQGRTDSLPTSIPYRNHVAQVLAYARRKDAEAFFSSKLATVDEPTAPFGLADVHGDGSEVDEAQASVPDTLAGRIRAAARRNGVTAATLFHAAWTLVVAHTSAREDVVFGTVLVGRLQAGASVEQMLGMLINTLPLRLQLHGLTAQQLIGQTQRELVELLSHEQASLALAQRCSGIGCAAPLFSALLNYRHSSSDAHAGWHGVEGVRVLAAQDRTNYPVVMSVDDLGVGFRLAAQTDRRIDPRRILAYLRTAVEALVSQLERSLTSPVLRLSILPEDERRELLERLNATRTEYPSDRAIHQVFEEQVAHTPAAVAAVWHDERVSYATLNARANRLAHQLRAQGVETGDYVAILMCRSLQMLVAQIAVLKSGAVYVPIDPDLPAERQAFIIRDCCARVLLVDGVATVAATVSAVVIDCADLIQTAGALPESNLGLSISPLAPAYVMYTSGSTGVPKGVVVPHHAVNRLAINNGYAQIGPSDCIPHYSNPAFDASTFEVWGALLTGARVLVLPQSVVFDGPRFAQVLQQERVTILWITVGLFNRYSDVLADVFPQLRYLMSGGDSLEPGAIRRVLRTSPPQHLLNMYGPTECTTFATSHLIDSLADDVANIPIGRPIANARIYILDADRQLVPVGVPGELYIGGAGVACGYLNRPDLTAERFLPDPFSDDSTARVYRTGDLGAWRADGTIEFLGRNDHQVKIRGFRVELGEIEAHLARHPAIKEAAVVARQDVPGEKRLVAYVTMSGPGGVRAEDLRSHLKDALPEYMLPSAYVVLDALPLSASGKVNRRTLPAPSLDAYVSREYEPPHGKVESELAAIWKEVLMVERVGRHDNFFELGGHSLLALKVLFRARESLGEVLNVTDLYTSPTICGIAQRIEAGVTEQQFVDLSREAALDPCIVALPGPQVRRARSILLTGGTGFVGRFLLAQLLQETDATIHCLVRAQSQRQAAVRLRSTLAVWDLWREEFEHRLVAVRGDLRLPQLGIEPVTYEGLCRSVDAIYHCGTSMNHLETYEMARAANVRSAKELLHLATNGRPKLINYISTLGVFSTDTLDVSRVVSEVTPIDDERHPLSRGYSASKWVGEKIFMVAGSRGIPCNIFRLGLVWADSEQGRYDELQREYRILKTCLLSGLGIKHYHPVMPPTPVDYVARAVVHLAGAHAESGGVFHICAPGCLVERTFERCNETVGTRLELLPYPEWIARIKRLHHRGWSLPAVPLIEYAFSMDAQTLREHERAAARITFDCSRTHRELGSAGIFAPPLDDRLLVKCIETMLARDAQLRDAWERPDEALVDEPLIPAHSASVPRLQT